jgi:hypothetical protein
MHAGPLVMEEESHESAPGHDGTSAEASVLPAEPSSPEADAHAGEQPSAGRGAESHAHAGICTGLRADCVSAGRSHTGIRHRAQLRLNDCMVDSERLKSAVISADAELRHNRTIRRFMRETYGPPDQDYEDWQIIAMSDMESGAACL